MTPHPWIRLALSTSFAITALGGCQIQGLGLLTPTGGKTPGAAPSPAAAKPATPGGQAAPQAKDGLTAKEKAYGEELGRDAASAAAEEQEMEAFELALDAPAAGYAVLQTGSFPPPPGGTSGGMMPPPPGGTTGGMMPPPPGGTTGGTGGMMPPPPGGTTGGTGGMMPPPPGGTTGGQMPPPPGGTTGGTGGMMPPPPGGTTGGTGGMMPPPPGGTTGGATGGQLPGQTGGQMPGQTGGTMPPPPGGTTGGQVPGGQMPPGGQMGQPGGQMGTGGMRPGGMIQPTQQGGDFVFQLPQGGPPIQAGGAKGQGGMVGEVRATIKIDVDAQALGRLATRAHGLITEAARANIEQREDKQRTKLAKRVGKQSEAVGKVRAALASAKAIDNGDGTMTRSCAAETTKAVDGKEIPRQVEVLRTTDAKGTLVASLITFEMALPNGAVHRARRTKTLLADGGYAIVFERTDTFPGSNAQRCATVKKVATPDGDVKGSGVIEWKDGEETIATVPVTVTGTADAEVITANDPVAQVEATVTAEADGDVKAEVEDTGEGVSAPVDVDVAADGTVEVETPVTEESGVVPEETATAAKDCSGKTKDDVAGDGDDDCNNGKGNGDGDDGGAQGNGNGKAEEDGDEFSDLEGTCVDAKNGKWADCE